MTSLASANDHLDLKSRLDPLLGELLGDTYRVERLIAKGGMGAVYEAEQVRLHRRVAVKVLLEQGQHVPELISRFSLESEIVTRLEHPHIVQVLDVGHTSEGFPYLVTEYLEGETLRERLRRDKILPVLEAVRIVSQLSSALAQVHSRGFVHCDIKPSNVFLMRVEGMPDFVKLLDFGVSIARGGSGLVASGQVLGTPCFMAPEQAQGQSDLDHRADQFAAAAIAYEMLSGRKAFSDPHGSEGFCDPPPLSQAAPWIPAQFDDVLSRALSSARERRYASISRFAWALENAAAHLHVETTPAGSQPEPELGKRERAPELHHAVPEQRPSSPPTRVDRPARPTAAFAVPATPEDTTVQRTLPSTASGLFSRAQAKFGEGNLDEAVESAERLLELGI
ncbi:MAG TPA: serine/threonine-protein kinase [Polyangiaceae bacterium]|jgi:serine/threonine-protein kinase|nr:serine/threonine-protein kinase [Polyangiaceae bacterium]